MRLWSGDFAAEGDFNVIDMGTWWKVEHVGEIDAGLETYIVDHAGGGIVEVAVLAEICAIAGGLAFEIDLADDAVLNEGFQAVVYGSEGNIRKAILHPHENIVRGGVISLRHQSPVNLLALACHSETGDFLGDLGF